MRKYSIYENSNESRICIKEGWNWILFFFAPFWFMFKGMFLVGAVVFIIGYGLSYLGGILNPPISTISTICSILLAPFFALKGTIFYSNHLVKNGYELKGTIDAKNSAQALDLYLNKE